MKQLTLEQQVVLMVDYLKMKLDCRDWHGVADAAMDIRELEARIKGRADGKESTSQD